MASGYRAVEEAPHPWMVVPGVVEIDGEVSSNALHGPAGGVDEIAEETIPSRRSRPGSKSTLRIGHDKRQRPLQRRPATPTQDLSDGVHLTQREVITGGHRHDHGLGLVASGSTRTGETRSPRFHNGDVHATLEKRRLGADPVPPREAAPMTVAEAIEFRPRCCEKLVRRSCILSDHGVRREANDRVEPRLSVFSAIQRCAVPLDARRTDLASVTAQRGQREGVRRSA